MIRPRLRSLPRDQRGVSALEFALVAPVFIAIFFGLVETGQVLLAGRRTAHAANVIGDLVAQKSSVAVADVTDSFAAGAQMLLPMPSSGLSMKVTSVTMQSNGKAVVDWSRPYNGMAADVKGTVMTLPANLLTKQGDSAIVSTANYALTQVSHYVLAGAYNFNRVAYSKPRNGSQVTCTNC